MINAYFIQQRRGEGVESCNKEALVIKEDKSTDML